MVNLELVEHICEYCSELNDFGYMIVEAYDFQDFVKGLPMESERPIECAIMPGYLSIHIDDLTKGLYLSDETKEILIKKLNPNYDGRRI